MTKVWIYYTNIDDKGVNFITKLFDKSVDWINIGVKVIGVNLINKYCQVTNM